MLEDSSVPIDHDVIIDPWGELRQHEHYVPYHGFCGICDTAFVVTPRIQKFLLEIKRIPVKMLTEGAAYCGSCARRRGRMKSLARAMSQRGEKGLHEQWYALRDEERALREGVTRRVVWGDWPYEYSGLIDVGTPSNQTSH